MYINVLKDDYNIFKGADWPSFVELSKLDNLNDYPTFVIEEINNITSIDQFEKQTCGNLLSQHRYLANNELKYKFNLSNTIDRNYSRSWQDLFVLSVLDGKTNGFFLEIGANDPIAYSNTYLLESKFGYTGISIDIDGDYRTLWDTYRSASFVEQDALTIDYSQLLKQNDAPKIIDYLQLDIEPGDNTFAALKLIPFDEYQFQTITFETELFRGNIDVREQSREYLINLGYMLVSKDVAMYLNPFWVLYEDWYVHNSVSSKFVNDILLSYQPATAEKTTLAYRNFLKNVL